MKNKYTTGFINGVIAAVSYGTNPLFALPMFANGFEVNSVLFYRYFFAVIIYALWIKFFKKVSFKISIKQFFVLFILGIIFSFSSLFLFDAFNYIDAGLACTILFSYPLMVALISGIIFREKIPIIVWIAIFMVILGIILLYNGGTENLSNKGVCFVLLSALSYAVYMVCIRNLKIIKHLKYEVLTFYIMLLGLSIYIWNLKFCTELQPLNSPLVISCSLLLALFPTIISLESITVAIKLIGASSTAILGALEPITALLIGVLFFNEVMTVKILLGIVLILTAVTMVAISPKGKKKN